MSTIPHPRTTPPTQAMRDFVARLPLVMDEAHRLGLHVTGHAMHEAVRKSGYELADLIEKHAKETK